MTAGASPTPLTSTDLLSFGEDGEWLLALGHVDLGAFCAVAGPWLRDLDYDVADDDLEPRHRYMRPARRSDFPDGEDGWAMWLRAEADDWAMWCDEPEDGAEPITIVSTEW